MDEPRSVSCEHWRRRMYAKFREKGFRHITCGRPWADHGELGECPARPVAERKL